MVVGVGAVGLVVAKFPAPVTLDVLQLLRRLLLLRVQSSVLPVALLTLGGLPGLGFGALLGFGHEDVMLGPGDGLLAVDPETVAVVLHLCSPVGGDQLHLLLGGGLGLLSGADVVDDLHGVLQSVGVLRPVLVLELHGGPEGSDGGFVQVRRVPEDCGESGLRKRNALVLPLEREPGVAPPQREVRIGFSRPDGRLDEGPPGLEGLLVAVDLKLGVEEGFNLLAGERILTSVRHLPPHQGRQTFLVFVVIPDDLHRGVGDLSRGEARLGPPVPPLPLPDVVGRGVQVGAVALV